MKYRLCAEGGAAIGAVFIKLGDESKLGGETAPADMEFRYDLSNASAQISMLIKRAASEPG